MRNGQIANLSGGFRRNGSGLQSEIKPVLSSRRPEAALAALRILQVAFFPLDLFVPRHDHLRDAVAGVNGIRFAAQIEQNHAEFASVSAG